MFNAFTSNGSAIQSVGATLASRALTDPIDPYPIQFGTGDWITVVTNSTGTFTGEMTLPDGTVIPPTGKAFDVEFGQTTKWEGDQLIVISAFFDAALQRQQLGLA